MRLGTAPPLRARLLAPQIYRREPDPKARGDHRRRQTGRISQQHPLAQISRIGAWHHCLLQETNHSTHMQHAFQIHTESALIALSREEDHFAPEQAEADVEEQRRYNERRDNSNADRHEIDGFVANYPPHQDGLSKCRN